MAQKKSSTTYPGLPTEGAKAPNFSCLDDSGEKVSLKELKGQTVILYFYPKDNTSGCTKQAQGFRDHFNKIKKSAILLGVSPDSQKSHQGFREKHELPFSLLVDSEHALAEKFGVWVEKSMYGRKYWGILRTTFLIDKDSTGKRLKPECMTRSNVQFTQGFSAQGTSTATAIAAGALAVLASQRGPFTKEWLDQSFADGSMGMPASQISGPEGHTSLRLPSLPENLVNP